MDAIALIEAALEVRQHAYAPYSDYAVGAALLDCDNQVHTGANVENASYPVCCCAERAALHQAVSRGKREFRAIAIVGGRRGEALPLKDYAFPCGVCRQALFEFAPEIDVIVARDPYNYQSYKLSELLQKGFGPHNLESR